MLIHRALQQCKNSISFTTVIDIDINIDLVIFQFESLRYDILGLFDCAIF